MISIPFIIAHRGASAAAPENTLAAFKKAYEQGATWLEFDVQLAACDELIIIHDHKLKRTTNGKGKVADFSYSQLLELDAGSWFSGEFSNEKIPCLIDTIAFLGKHQMSANLELKPMAGQEQQLVKAVIDLIEQSWPETSAPPIVSSFNWGCLSMAREHSNDIQLGLLVEKWRDDALEKAAQLQCCSIHVANNCITEELVGKIKDAGFLVLSYTVNDTNRAQQLKKWGIDAVFTDYPDIISAAIRSTGD